MELTKAINERRSVRGYKQETCFQRNAGKGT